MANDHFAKLPNELVVKIFHDSIDEEHQNKSWLCLSHVCVLWRRLTNHFYWMLKFNPSSTIPGATCDDFCAAFWRSVNLRLRCWTCKTNDVAIYRHPFVDYPVCFACLTKGEENTIKTRSDFTKWNVPFFELSKVKHKEIHLVTGEIIYAMRSEDTMHLQIMAQILHKNRLFD